MSEQEKRGPGGNPTLCTPEIIAEAGRLALAGNFYEPIYILLGISKATAYNWLQWGEEGREPFKEYLDAIKSGWAAAEARISAQLQQHGTKASEGQWTPLAWFLERRFADRWGKRTFTKQEISGPGGKPVEYRRITAEQIEQLLIEETPPDDSDSSGEE